MICLLFVGTGSYVSGQMECSDTCRNWSFYHTFEFPKNSCALNLKERMFDEPENPDMIAEPVTNCVDLSIVLMIFLPSILVVIGLAAMVCICKRSRPSAKFPISNAVSTSFQPI